LLKTRNADGRRTSESRMRENFTYGLMRRWWKRINQIHHFTLQKFKHFLKEIADVNISKFKVCEGLQIFISEILKG
jgi:hypothetical protein